MMRLWSDCVEEVHLIEVMCDALASGHTIAGINQNHINHTWIFRTVLSEVDPLA
jgi:hypothetical protein